MIRQYGAIAGLVLILIGVTSWYVFLRSEPATQTNQEDTLPIVPNTDAPVQVQPGAAIGDENLVVFACEGGKTITAVFESDVVGLTLSDGRQIVLREAPTASGARYLSNDTRIELASKGEGAILRENGETTYDNCIAGE